MGDVVIFIEDTDMNSSFSRCRICHEEEEAESYFEAPCSCSGTVKFAHRDCIQRWCDEKGNTICEICLQDYKPGYTTTSRPSRLVEATATTRPNGSEDIKKLAHQDVKPTSCSQLPATVTTPVRQNREKEGDKGTVLPASQVTLSNRFDALLEQEE